MHCATEAAEVLTGEDAVRLPVPGGWMATAWPNELRWVVRAAAAFTPDAPA